MYELRLQEGRAHDALHEMRQHLRVRAHHYKLKDKYARGVRYNTRAPILQLASLRLKLIEPPRSIVHLAR